MANYFKIYSTRAAHNADHTPNSENYEEPWVALTTEAPKSVSYNVVPGLTVTYTESGTNKRKKVYSSTITSTTITGLNITKSSVNTIRVYNGVTTLGSSCFKDCTNATSVKLPYGLTAIPESMMENCASVEEIVIPVTVTSIGNNAFKGCEELDDVIVPEGVTSIGNSAFSGDESLGTLTVMAQTPPTLGTTVFGSLQGIDVYVPAASVAAYLADSSWGALHTGGTIAIQAIS